MELVIQNVTPRRAEMTEGIVDRSLKILICHPSKAMIERKNQDFLKSRKKKIYTIDTHISSTTFGDAKFAPT